MADGDLIGQNEIERMLAEAQKASGGDAATVAPAASPAAAAPAAQQSGHVDQASIDALLNQAQAALGEIDGPPTPLPAGVTPFEFKPLPGGKAANESAGLDMLNDVQLDLKIELGRTQMNLEEVLRLNDGAVITLDKLAGDPVDIYANGRLIARGEVLVLNDNFCVRIAELVAAEAAA
ncbi:MAG: flagellar motor switch protein FliN [Pirellulales bacterium]|nr:flagellar motor switch protein FliN [Pirellulales bacterium]